DMYVTLNTILLIRAARFLVLFSFILYLVIFSHLFIFFLFFFFNDTATTEIYTLSLHDALPISSWSPDGAWIAFAEGLNGKWSLRSEEHTSELQSRRDLVCRLLLEKKKKKKKKKNIKKKKNTEYK